MSALRIMLERLSELINSLRPALRNLKPMRFTNERVATESK